MISKQELAEIKERKNSNLFYQEKEYLQYIFLHSISKYQVVFKGGTCLKICYGLERASEDLDFSSNLSAKKIDKIFKDCLKNFDLLNIEYEKPIKKEFQGNIRYEVKIKGPLYNGNRNSMNSLKIDFNNRKIYNKNAKVIQNLFPDIPVFTIQVLSEEEILAEKIRSLVKRNQSRDFYDAWFLIQKNIKPDKKLLNKKLKQENAKLSDIKFPSKQEYERDLKQLVTILPDYKQAKFEIEKFIKKLR